MTVSSNRMPSRFIPSEEIGEGQVQQWHFGDVAMLQSGFVPLGPLAGASLDPLIRPRPAALQMAATPEHAAEEEASQPGISEEELHEHMRQAHQEGFTQGMQEGMRQGTEQGLQQARAEAEQQLAHTEQQWQQRLHDYQTNIGNEAAQHLAAVVAEAQNGIRGLQQQMAPDLLQLACDIARQVVRQELRSNPQALLPVVREALDMLGAETKPSTVRINPEDWAHLEPHLRAAMSNPRIEWLADASVARGGCRVECNGAHIDGSLERRWQRAVAALGLVSTWYDDGTQPAATHLAATTATGAAHG